MIMSESKMHQFISDIDRTELSQNPVIYTKAVRVCLRALGFDGAWVDGPFREALEAYCMEDFDAYNLDQIGQL